MRLRIKLYYISVGWQSIAAFMFALMGHLPFALMATFFAVTSWYGAEIWLKEELNAVQTKKDGEGI